MQQEGEYMRDILYELSDFLVPPFFPLHNVNLPLFLPWYNESIPPIMDDPPRINIPEYLASKGQYREQQFPQY